MNEPETVEQPPIENSGEEKELLITLSKRASFADLFKAIEAVEEKEGLGKVHFDEELWDNFAEEIVNEVLSFQEDAQKGRAATTKIIDFFQERGYDQKDISAYLPVKFRESAWIAKIKEWGMAFYYSA